MIEWFTFLIIMALGQFSPGPDMIFLTRTALAHGAKSGYAVASGIATGLMIHAGIAILVLTGFTKVKVIHPHILLGIYGAIILYLSWLAYGLLRASYIGFYSGSTILLDGEEEGQRSETAKQFFLQGFLCNILNPKVALFLASVVLPFYQFHPDSVGWAFTLWATIFIEGLILWCAWVKLLQAPKIKSWYTNHAYIIDGLFGLALLVLIVLLARGLF